MQRTLKILGAFLAVLALLGILTSLYTLIDPREAQLSNDVNPFGAPPTIDESLFHVVAWLVLLVFGLWLFFRRRAR